MIVKLFLFCIFSKERVDSQTSLQQSTMSANACFLVSKYFFFFSTFISHQLFFLSVCSPVRETKYRRNCGISTQSTSCELLWNFLSFAFFTYRCTIQCNVSHHDAFLFSLSELQSSRVMLVVIKGNKILKI